MVFNKFFVFWLLFSFSFSGTTYCQDVEPKQLDWTQLQSFGSTALTGDKPYEITKITLKLPKNKDTPWGKGIFEGEEDSFDGLELNDEKTLRFVERCFDSVLRVQSRAVSSFHQIGELEVKTNNGKFKIGISNRGFTYGTQIPSDKNTFFSWGLAKILDEICRKKFGKRGLRQNVFKILSGQHFADRDKYQFQRIMNSKTKDTEN